MPTNVTILDDGNIEGYLTVKQYAKKNGYNEGAIRRQIQMGKLDSIAIGEGRSCLRFIKEDAVPNLSKQGPKKHKTQTITVKLTGEQYAYFMKMMQNKSQ